MKTSLKLSIDWATPVGERPELLGEETAAYIFFIT